MGVPPLSDKENSFLEEMMLQLTGIDITKCPCCNKDKMQLLEKMPKYRARAPNTQICAAGKNKKLKLDLVLWKTIGEVCPD